MAADRSREESSGEQEVSRRSFARFWDAFTFLRIPGLDATNWRAEQAIRPAVVNRTFWGGNRTPAGAARHGLLLSVLETLPLIRHDPLACFARARTSPTALKLVLRR